MTDYNYTALCFGETNQGLVRSNNEDAYICETIWDESHLLCVAIDGLGGYEGGEIAAEIARTTIIKHLEDFASKKATDLMRDALTEANNAIVRHREREAAVSQMGCVVSAGLIDLTQGIITIAHVGDSRIYQLSGGELKKLTHDHSLVGYREEMGEMTEEAAMTHPRRNVIDRFLGEGDLDLDTASDYIEVSVWPITGDSQYLFCTDGLTDLVTSNQIRTILSSGCSVEDEVKNLIQAANDAGGKDNVTVVIADVRCMQSAEDGSDDENYPCETCDNNKIETPILASEVQEVEDRSGNKRVFKKSIVIELLLGVLILIGVSILIFSYKINGQFNEIERNQSKIMDLIEHQDSLIDQIIHPKDSLNEVKSDNQQ